MHFDNGRLPLIVQNEATMHFWMRCLANVTRITFIIPDDFGEAEFEIQLIEIHHQQGRWIVFESLTFYGLLPSLMIALVKFYMIISGLVPFFVFASLKISARYPGIQGQKLLSKLKISHCGFEASIDANKRVELLFSWHFRFMAVIENVPVRIISEKFSRFVLLEFWGRKKIVQSILDTANSPTAINHNVDGYRSSTFEGSNNIQLIISFS